MMNNINPRAAEHTHTKRCMFGAMKSALENARDAEYFTDVEFHINLQSGDLVREAYAYLQEGLQTCICPVCHRACCDGYIKNTFDTETERNLERR